MNIQPITVPNRMHHQDLNLCKWEEYLRSVLKIQTTLCARTAEPTLLFQKTAILTMRLATRIRKSKLAYKIQGRTNKSEGAMSPCQSPHQTKNLLEFLQMGRLFRFYFEDPDYFICSNCGTHIALQEDQESIDEIEPGVLEGLFLTVVNVEVNDQQRPLARDGNHSVSDIYCIKCGDKLGFKYILTFIDGRIIKNELVQLRMNKLLLSEEDLKRKNTMEH